MMSCSICGMDLPDKGDTCPHCGANSPGREIAQLTLMGMMILGAVVGCLVGLVQGAGALGTVAGIVGGGVIGRIWAAKRRADYEHCARAKRIAEEERLCLEAQIAAATTRIVPFTVPPMDFAAVAHREELRLLASGHYRKCPHCAEVIKIDANVCRFCQRDTPPITAER